MTFFLLSIIAFILIILFFFNNKEDLRPTVADLKNQISYQMDTINSLKNEISSLKHINEEQLNELNYYKSLNANRKNYLNTLLSSDNLSAFPYVASLIADYKTIDLDFAIASLSWGNNKARKKKVQSLIEIKRILKDTVAAYKNIEYQLEYLKTLFPNIDAIIETPYCDLSIDFSSHDTIRSYVSDEEYNLLSESECNQLALDRYILSRSKNTWEIGRDYELYVGYEYSTRGYSIDYYGSYMKLNDLGRDLIAKRNDDVLIIQCKCWSKDKIIHEKHIAQLYGTYICYCLENNISEERVHPVFITSTFLSEQAKSFCNYLKISYKENYPLGVFPRIKCNIGTDEYGIKSHIYHLPMDQQYDNVKIDKPGEFFAFTVAEAESKGFRRAYKWHQNTEL